MQGPVDSGQPEQVAGFGADEFGQGNLCFTCRYLMFSHAFHGVYDHEPKGADAAVFFHYKCRDNKLGPARVGGLLGKQAIASAN